MTTKKKRTKRKVKTRKIQKGQTIFSTTLTK